MRHFGIGDLIIPTWRGSRKGNFPDDLTLAAELPKANSFHHQLPAGKFIDEVENVAGKSIQELLTFFCCSQFWISYSSIIRNFAKLIDKVHRPTVLSIKQPVFVFC